MPFFVYFPSELTANDHEFVFCHVKKFGLFQNLVYESQIWPLFFSSLNKNFGQNTRRTEKLLISDDQLHPITTAAHQILLCEVVNCTHLAHARIHSIARVRLRPKAVEKRAVHEVGGAAALEVDVVIVAHTHTHANLSPDMGCALPRFNFINVLQAAFAPVDPKSIKRY